MRSYFLFFLLCLWPHFAPTAMAAMEEPKRSLHGWGVPVQKEDAVRVKTAKVLVADYELIRRDFPRTREMSVEQINQWLLDNMAYVSATQTRPNEVTGHIEFDPKDTKTVSRPQFYGRAWIGEVEGGLIDAKGVGSIDPRKGHHGNGLATTGECLREYLFEKMASKALKAGGETANTVGTYAVFDYGFDVIHDDGSRSPAGEVLRQADTRWRQQVSNLNPERAAEIESVLRRFGITTAGDVRGPEGDWINLQMGHSGNLVDFGAYLVVDKFEAPAMTYDGVFNDIRPQFAPELQQKLIALLHPDITDFPQPEAEIRVPLDQWGSAGKIDPKSDRMWNRMHDVANAFRHGHMSAEQIQQEVNGYLGRLDEIFKEAKPSPKKPWVSFVQRLKAVIGKNIANGSKLTDEFYQRLTRPGFVLERDMDDLAKLADEGGGSYAVRAFEFHAGEQLVEPELNWEKLRHYGDSGSKTMHGSLYYQLGQVLEYNREIKFSSEQSTLLVKWFKEAGLSDVHNDHAAFYRVVKNNRMMRQAILEDLRKPANSKKALAGLTGKDADRWFRFIEPLNPSAKDENLLRGALTMFDRPNDAYRAAHLFIDAEPFPYALLDEVAGAAEKLNPKLREKLLARIEKAKAEMKGKAMAKKAPAGCGGKFASLQ